jgi:hypothetical protein
MVATLGCLVYAPASALAQRPCPEGNATPDYVTTVDEAKKALGRPAATRVPDDACDGQPGGPTQLPYFDDHSWRTFIALVWPALESKGVFRTIRERGVPNPELDLEPVLKPEAVPRGPSFVFETYKADWETFPFDGEKPHQWNDDTAEWSDLQWQCKSLGAQAGDLFLAPSTADYPDTYSKRFKFFDNVVEFAFAEPGSMLVAQNGTLVRYLAAYNQIEFNQIFAKEWFRADHLPDPKMPDQKIEFLAGSLSVKSAWVDMGRLDGNKLVGGYTVAHPETFHRRKAWLVDPYPPSGPICEQHVVGLVGLHIVQKTPKHPRWIWATFEHVNNAPDNFQPLPGPGTPVPLPSCPISSNPPRRYTFNSGMGAMHSMTFPLDQLFLAGCPPAPLDIERKKPINNALIKDDTGKVLPNTQDTNKVWRQALHEKGSVWLVMTQWPTGNGTIPGPGVFQEYATANSALETWFQGDVTSSCMSCHRIAEQDDFVWSLRMNAYPRTQSRSSQPVRDLQKLLGTQLQ